MVGHSLIAQVDSGNNVLRRYVHGPGVDEPLVWYEGSGTSDRRFLHADERGSIVAVSDSSGAVTNVNTYDEYGVPASTNVGRFQYTGQAWIPEVQLYYYRGRFYNPSLGRFMQTDPIGFGGGMNLYAYVGGDPVNLSDPSGLAGERCITTGSLICNKNSGPICDSCSGSSTGGGSSGSGRGASGAGSAASYGSSSSSGETTRAPTLELWKFRSEYGVITLGYKPTGTTASPEVRYGFGDLGIQFQLASYQPQLGASEYQIASRLASQELARTRAQGPVGSGHNDIYDAERHARWSYRMAVHLGVDVARRFGNLHELQNVLEGGPFRETRMDLWNNNVGLQAFERGEPIPTRGHPQLRYFGGPSGSYGN